MSYEIIKQLTKTNKGSKGANKPEWIIVHFVGASGQAKSNANYFEITYRGSSAHYFADPKEIRQVVEDDTPAWHVGDGSRSGKGQYNGYKGYGATNNNSIGVEMCQDTSTGKDAWTWDFHPETVIKALWLIKQLQKKYNIPDSRVIRHFDVSGKICPGNWQYNGWAKWFDFKKRLAGVVTSTPSTNKVVNEGKPNVVGNKYLVQTGDTLYGIAQKHNVTTKQLVEWNSLDNPDLILPESYLFIGSKPEVKPVVKTTAELVKEVNAGIHGNGEQRKKSLGSRYDEVMGVINGSSKPAPKMTPKPKVTQLKLDGSWGKGTTVRLQEVLGSKPADGIISGQYKNSVTDNIHSVSIGKGGSNVVRVMQRKLGVKDDGYIGKDTISALQRRMGTPVTGAISGSGSAVVIAMQKRLNENRF